MTTKHSIFAVYEVQLAERFEQIKPQLTGMGREPGVYLAEIVLRALREVVTEAEISSALETIYDRD